MPAESRNQQIAAIIAKKAKEEGKKPKAGTASASMAKMSDKDLKKFTKLKKGAPKKKNESTVNEGNAGYEETKAGQMYQMAVLQALEEDGMTFEEADNMIDIEYDLIGDCLSSGRKAEECAEMIVKKNSAGLDDGSADELPGARHWTKHDAEKHGLGKIWKSTNEAWDPTDYKDMLSDDMADTYEKIMDYLTSLENDGDFEEINLVLAKILTNIDVIEDETLYDMILNNEDKKAIADYAMDKHYIGLGPKAKKKRLEYLEKYGDVHDGMHESSRAKLISEDLGFSKGDLPFNTRSRPSEFEQDVLDRNKKTSTIQLTAQELKTFMDDIAEHGNWSRSSFRIIEFMGIDPHDGL